MTGGGRGALDFARRDPLVALLFALAAAAAVLPVWIGRYLPLLDYPNHLSIVFVWRHLHDPAWGFSRFYETHLVPLPYWAQYGMVYALSIPFGIEAAQKLFLTGALLSLPAFAGLLARRMGRDPRLAIFAFPLAWNYNVENGFLAYAAGTSVLLLGLFLLDRHAETPSFKWGTAAALVGASLYFFHILSWGTFLAVGGVTSLLAPRPARSAWRWLGARVVAPLPLVPALAVGLWAYRASKTMKVKVAPWTAHGWDDYETIYYSVGGVLKGLPDWLMNFVPGGLDEAMAIVLGGAWIFLLASRPAATGTAARDWKSPGLRDWRLEAGTAAAALLLFKLPRTLHRPFYWYAINSRIAVVVALLAALWVRGPVAQVGSARRVFFFVAAAAAIAYPLDLAAHFHRFNLRARDFDVVMESAAPGKEVLPLMLRLGDDEVNVNCFNQWGSYVQLRQGGYVPYNNEIDFPLRRLRGLLAPYWDHPEQFRFKLHGREWDYFLVHGPSPIDPFTGEHEHVRLVKKAGEWELWEKREK